MSKMPGTTLLLAVTAIATQAAAFQTASLLPRSQALQRVQQPRAAAPDEDAETASASLEEKMAGWEASAEEQRKATLGGLIPGKPGFMTRTDQPDKVDGFDVGVVRAHQLRVRRT